MYHCDKRSKLSTHTTHHTHTKLSLQSSKKTTFAVGEFLGFVMLINILEQTQVTRSRARPRRRAYALLLGHRLPTFE